MLRKILFFVAVLLAWAAIDQQRITDLIPTPLKAELPQKVVQELDKLGVSDIKVMYIYFIMDVTVYTDSVVANFHWTESPL